jgi:hypothetical protein
MNTTTQKQPNLYRQVLTRGLMAMASAALLAVVAHGQTAPPPPGYLTKSAPSVLRFAPIPKPPAGGLPPLPITLDPQPTYSPEFASAIPDAFRPASMIVSGQTNSPKAPPAGLVVMPAPASNAKATAVTPESGTASPQMLIKLRPDGKPGGIEMYPGDWITFQTPVREERRSSSATYEIK